MHPQNPYNKSYDLKQLSERHADLQKHIILNPTGTETIDFGDAKAVFELNKAILLADFKLTDYQLPKGYLIAPIPGRLEYLLQLKGFLAKELNLDVSSPLNGLDIGSGANGIYCILAAQGFNWNMVGSDCDSKAVSIANKNVQRTKGLDEKIEIRLQKNKSFLYKDIIKPQEQFDFTVCNPPFHSSKEEALNGSLRKLKNLGFVSDSDQHRLNFEGQAGELWCNGGEALFIKRLIKESLLFKDQVKVFSSLVSRSDHLPKIEKQLNKAKAKYAIIPMEQGNKISRIVVWRFV